MSNDTSGESCLPTSSVDHAQDKKPVETDDPTVKQGTSDPAALNEPVNEPCHERSQSRDSPMTAEECKRLLNDAFVKQKLTEEHIEKLSSSSPVTVRCVPCDQKLSMGKFYKGLSNVLDHKKNPKHELAVARYNDRKMQQMMKTKEGAQNEAKRQKVDEDVRLKEKMDKLYEEVQKSHGKKTFLGKCDPGLG